MKAKKTIAFFLALALVISLGLTPVTPAFAGGGEPGDVYADRTPAVSDASSYETPARDQREAPGDADADPGSALSDASTPTEQGPSDALSEAPADRPEFAHERQFTPDEDGNVSLIIKLYDVSLTNVAQDSVVETLQAYAKETQTPVLDSLHDMGIRELNTFWLTNAIFADVPVDLIPEVERLPGVEWVFENFTLTIPEPAQDEEVGAYDEYTWGLDMIRAPDAWALGFTGEGVRVAVSDTGVAINHPDLAGKMWTDDPNDPTYPGGWIEFDANGNIVVGSTPHDTSNHGTHCSGTVLGGDASGTHIGVAPGAILMHALNIPGGGGTWPQVIAGMEWKVDPVDQFGNPAGEPADVTSMSWGADGLHSSMIAPIQNMEAAGVVPISSIGNSGAGVTGSPGNVYECFGIGATTSTDMVAAFSGGQVVNDPAFHPEPYVKPDFSAPGVGVWSSVPPATWTNMSGTSMASPHVAGAVALMLSANPALTIPEIYQILKDTAVWHDHYASEPPDIRYGWGRIDAYEAVVMAGAIDSGIEGVVTDAGTGDPIEGAEVYCHEAGTSRNTDEDGYYQFLLPPGEYTLTADAFGYDAVTVEDIEVEEEVFTVQNFALDPLPAGFVEGTVAEAGTGVPIEGAGIALIGTELVATTDEHGYYHLEAPEGTYDVHASHPGYYDDTAYGVEVVAGETIVVDFALEASAEVDWRWLYPATWRPEVENALGLTAPGEWWGAMRIDLSDDIGKEITHIAYYDYDVAADYAIGYVSPNVDGGTWGAPASPWAGSTAEYTPADAGWVELPLLDPVTVEAPGIYWVVMEFYDFGDQFFPFGLIEPAVTYGDLVNLADPHDPFAWDRLPDFGINWSFAVEARVVVAIESGIEGIVTDADTGDPIEGAEVYCLEADTTRYTDEDGFYRFHLHPGTYTLTASEFGYQDETAVVDVVEDTFTVQDFALELDATGFIEGTVTDVDTGDPIEGAEITLLGTTLGTTTDEDGYYIIEAPTGTYDVRAQASGYQPSVAPGVEVPADDTVIVDFELVTGLPVAVLGDYQSQLTDLLIDHGFVAEERDWDVVGEVGDYVAVVINKPTDPGAATFIQFLDEADQYGVGVIFLHQRWFQDPWGITLLHDHLGDPGHINSFGGGDVFYEVLQEHPIFDGWSVGDDIVLIDDGPRDHGWFDDYTGDVIGELRTTEHPDRGPGAAVAEYGASQHVLLASLGVGTHMGSHIGHWTDDAETVFINAMFFAAAIFSGIDGYVTDADTGDPIEDASVYCHEADSTRYTDEDGYYRFTMPAGTYTLTADAFGYHAVTVEDIQVVEGELTPQDFALTPTPEFGFIDGTVTEVDTGDPVEDAEITLLGTPLSTTTDEDGYYHLQAPVGIYDVLFSHPSYQDAVVEDVEVIDGETTTVDFAFDPIVDLILWDITADPAGWDALISGQAPVGGWDFDDDPDYGLLGFVGPLTSAGAGPVSPGILSDDVAMDSQTGPEELVAVGPAQGFGNPSNAILANTFIDSFEIDLDWDGSGPKSAIEFDAVSIMGSDMVDVYVDGELIDVGVAAPPSGNRWGIFDPTGAGFIEVELYDTLDGAEGVQGSGVTYVVAIDSGIEGYVTDAFTGDPIEGAEVYCHETHGTRTTDEDGFYRFNVHPGTYTLTADAYGYFPVTVEDIEVLEDTFTEQDFALELDATGFIEGTVTDADTDDPIEGAEITVLDTPMSAITDEDGYYHLEAPVGTYDVRAWAAGYQESIAYDVDVPADATVTVDFALESVFAVAVLGDFQSQLTNLLIDHGFEAEERGWDVIGDIHQYAAVVVNQPTDPGSATFLDFLDAADDHGVGVVFTSSWPHTSPWGITLLINHLGDPAGSSDSFMDGHVYYEVTEAHPIFDGWDVGDEIILIDTGDMDHTWFWDYSGDVIADLGTVNTGIKGEGVGVAEYGASTHVLLASLGPQSWTNLTHWTPDARQVFINALYFAAVTIDSGITGQVTDADTGDPIEDAWVEVEETGAVRYTDEDGYYMFYLEPGTYTLTAGKFGYEEETAVVDVVDEEFTVQNFALTPVAEVGFIDGTVTDADTGDPIEGAEITVLDTPMSAITDEDGYYHLEVPVGTYDVHASHPDYYDDTAYGVEVIVDETTTVDFALEAPAEADWRWLYPAGWRYEPVENALGLTAPGEWWGAMRIDLSDDIGKEITHIAYYDYDVAADYAIGYVSPNVDGGAWGAPAAPWAGSTDEYTPAEAGWVELPLLDPVLVEEPGIYWVVMEFYDFGDGFFPFGLIEPAVTYGDLVNLADPHDPFAWDRLLDFGINWSFAVECRVVFDDIPPVEYTLTIDSTEGGEVTVPGEGDFPYEAGTVVELVAEADDHYHFVEWTGDIDEIDDPASAETTITMDDDYAITANFALVDYTLTIDSTEGGEVTVPGEGDFPYEAGTVVELVAEADDHYHFVEWTGDIDEIDDPASAETTITMDDDYAITAVFESLVHHYHWGDDWVGDVYGATEDVYAVAIVGETDTEVWWYHIAGDQWYYDEYSTDPEAGLPHEADIGDFWQPVHGLFEDYFAGVETFFFSRTAIDVADVPEPDPVSELLEAPVPDYYHYHWGDDWKGDVYGATGDVYAVTIVGETGSEVWWYYADLDQWFHDEYSIEPGLPHEADIDDFWQPVHGLFEDYFAGVDTFYYSRTAIDVGDVPVPDPVSTRLYYGTHYHWGDDWEGDVYGATEDVYAVAIVGETGSYVWWYHIAGEQWYYDEYSIETGLPHEADIGDFWQPVKGLFEDHFPGVDTFYYSRTMIDEVDVPEPTPVSELLLAL